MIRIEGIKKNYGALTAVDDVSFQIKPGEIFGLLGPNGAGKTTAINMISGVLRPDQGRILVEEQDIWKKPKIVKQKLGVVPQEIAVYEDLTARDNLNFFGSLFGLRGSRLKEKVNDNLDRVGLTERADDKVSSFSGGMKRRLNLCMGLLHQPKFLLLDEPTVGIDPQARLNIMQIIRQEAQNGTAVLYTTHYMDEAQELCDRIAIVDHGKILTQGRLAELTRLAGEAEILKLSGSFLQAQAKQKLRDIEGCRVLNAVDRNALLSIDPDGPGLLTVLPNVLACDLDIEDVSIQQPSLQNVFISLTGRELRD
jgi:ABC-2 type transport system ATP-binding protein